MEGARCRDVRISFGSLCDSHPCRVADAYVQALGPKAAAHISEYVLTSRHSSPLPSDRKAKNHGFRRRTIGQAPTWARRSGSARRLGGLHQRRGHGGDLRRASAGADALPSPPRTASGCRRSRPGMFPPARRAQASRSRDDRRARGLSRRYRAQYRCRSRPRCRDAPARGAP